MAMGMEDRGFADYLAKVDGTPEPEGFAGVVVIVASDPMEKVLSDLVAVEMLAKDLHYCAGGKPFYAIHELADVIWQTRRFRDDLNEVYWMGEKSVVPPSQVDIFREAIKTAVLAQVECNVKKPPEGELPAPEDGKLAALAYILGKTTGDIDVAKERGVSSGVCAVLDETAKFVLQSKGLVTRTLL